MKVIQLENVSKMYRLGEVGTGTISHDLARAWAKFRGKEDPFAKIGQINNREASGGEYVWALKDINLEVEEGEILGIIGRNGAGKSTLLKLLSRVTAPTTGHIRARGRIASLLEVGTGFHPELTGRENVYLNGALLGMTRREITRQMEEIVEFSGCAKYIDTPVKRYSSGMTVRLGFAVAAHLECEILIVDEVLAVGDAEFQKKCMGKMRDVAKGGRTILFVSHNLGAVESLCSQCMVINSGKIFCIDTSPEAIGTYRKKIANNTAHTKKTSPRLTWTGILNEPDLSSLSPDDDIHIQLGFQSGPTCLHQLAVDIAVVNHKSEWVIHGKTRSVGNAFFVPPHRKFSVDYRIESPRLTPGEYTLIVYAESELGVEFWGEEIQGVGIKTISHLEDGFNPHSHLGAVSPIYTINVRQSEDVKSNA